MDMNKSDLLKLDKEFCKRNGLTLQQLENIRKNSDMGDPNFCNAKYICDDCINQISKNECDVCDWPEKQDAEATGKCKWFLLKH